MRYIAHIREDGKEQTVEEHLKNVTWLAEKNCSIIELKNIISLAGMLHDAGKNTDEFLEYIEKAHEDPKSVVRGSVDHASAGGVTALTLQDGDTLGQCLSQLLASVIFSHHGMYDCVDFDGDDLFSKRMEKMREIPQIQEELYKIFPFDIILEKFNAAQKELHALMLKINEIVANKEGGKTHGSKLFYLGMLKRLVLSYLIDADRTDTAFFMSAKDIGSISFDAVDWGKYIANYRDYMAQIKNKKEKSTLDIYRDEISQTCVQAGEREGGIYRLIVPTGGGKTLSGLIFALIHAQKYNKSRIFYIAPFNSISEQNAIVIKDAIGDASAVLEHHCNVVSEDERYKELTENWASDFVVTSAVQFLNTLFLGNGSSVRRMQAVANSVIIIDEVQAIPIKCTELLNLAVNFLTRICHCTVVFCSATQPPFEGIMNNALLKPMDIIDNEEKYTQAFKRTEIIDETKNNNTGFDIDDMASFIAEKMHENRSLLAIVNTKACARNVFNKLEDLQKEGLLSETHIFHLSTGMCPKHRVKILFAVKECLKMRQKVICISTKLIEAGVDISFEAVVRSLAGLDSVMQAAGRCNRNGEFGMKKVYLIKMRSDAERAQSLTDIRIGGEVLEKMLWRRRNTSNQESSLMSKVSMDAFYDEYFYKRRSEMAYHVKLSEGATNIVDLLSFNSIAVAQMNRKKQRIPIMRQAFKTAGESFSVIRDGEKIPVIVEFDAECNELLQELGSNRNVFDKRKILRKLQAYTVNIYPYEERMLKGNFYNIEGVDALVLREQFYNSNIGISLEPSQMPLLEN